MKNFLLAASILLAHTTIAQTGNVGIGTTTPQSKLHTTGGVRHDTLAGVGYRLVYADSAGRLYTQPTQFDSSGGIPPIPIPDNGCSTLDFAYSAIPIANQPASVPSAAIRVRINITHPAVGQLQIFLISPSNVNGGPNGQRLLRLAGGAGGTGANFTHTIFHDSAAQTLPTISAGAPFTSHYKPTGGLNVSCGFAAFPYTNTFGELGNGGFIAPNGHWLLVVFDNANGSVGHINDWSITFDGTDPAVPTPILIPALEANVLPKNDGGVLGSSAVYEMGGKVGIGVAMPSGQLTLADGFANKKIVLQDFGNDHQFFGLGVGAYTMRYQTASSVDDHVFYTGASTTASTELMRIKGTGHVGIGVSAPTTRLDVAGTIHATAFTGAGNALTGVVNTTANQAIGGKKTFSDTVTAAAYLGNGGALTNIVNTATAQNIGGRKTFSDTVTAPAFVGDGRALSSVVNTSTAQTIAGAKTFSATVSAGAGITLPSAGGTSSILNHYETATFPITVGDAGSTYPGSFTAKAVRVGAQVTLSFPSGLSAFTSSNVGFLIVSGIPARFMPLSDVFVPLLVRSGGVASMGVAHVTTGASIGIYQSNLTTPFNGIGNCGIYVGAITYSVQ